MKFLHISDLHLGRRISSYSLCDLQSKQLDTVLNYIDENSINAVLISGDIYDKPIPSVEAVNLFDIFLTSLAEKNIHVFIISGNHDSPERLQFGNRLLEKNNIHIAGTFNGNIPKVTLNDEYGNINIYMIPFVKLSEIATFYPDEKFYTLSDAVERIIDDTFIDTNQRNIILYHGFVMHNNREPDISGSELQLGGMQMVDADIFSDFDYTALGHIHKPQSLGKNIRYSGSMMKYSFDEFKQEKSMTIVELKQKGEINIEVQPLTAEKDVRIVRGYFNDICHNNQKSDDFIKVELKDIEKIPFAMEILRERFYENILELVYLKDLKNISAISTSTSYVENRSMLELAKEFFNSVYNENLDGEKLEILDEICQEVLNETD